MGRTPHSYVLLYQGTVEILRKKETCRAKFFSFIMTRGRDARRGMGRKKDRHYPPAGYLTAHWRRTKNGA
jgi:hypothetical protein